jgi:glycosyltransferase involved in cell wall biosynthesis
MTNGENGVIDTRIDRQIDAMQHLRGDPAAARRLGEAARRTAQERFNIQRFIADWMKALSDVAA